MNTINEKQNSKGVYFRLGSEYGNYYVFKRCTNYAAHVHGGVSHSWRYILKTKDYAEALKVFEKKAEIA